MVKRQDNIAFSDIETINRFNEELLREHVRYCYENSPFYKNLFSQENIDPGEITCRRFLSKIPVTTRLDLEQYNNDFLCVSEREIVDLCQTSGTTAGAVNLLQTSGDLARVGYNEEISFKSAGITQDDRVMVACALGRCFMAGLAYFEGVRRIGAMAIRVGSGKPSILSRAVVDHRPTVIVCVPSQVLLMAKALAEFGINTRDLGVQKLVCIGEPVRNTDFGLNPLGLKLAEVWGSSIVGTYASTEMATSFTDCEYGRGGHFHPELIVVEVLDDDHNPVGPGKVGELIVTPLQVMGMPLLRFCTGDLAAYHTEPCECGRNTYRLGPIVGRKNQKMKIRGTTVYPSAVYTVLQDIPEVENYYLEVFDEHILSDTLCVTIGANRNCGLTEESVAEKLRGKIRVRPKIKIEKTEIVAQKVFQEGKRKPQLFFDYRSNK